MITLDTLKLCVLLSLEPFLVDSVNSTVGTFWWFTDMHVDVWGSLDEELRCAWTPSAQMISGLNAMKEINENPDFILMSGDIVHFPKRNSSDLTPELIAFTIEEVTSMITKTFPNTKVYGALGNHDLSPSNNWPTDPTESKWLYDTLKSIWSPWLPPSALKTLGETGWYSADVEGIPGLRIITINTNYWAFYNTYLIFDSSVADAQWKWLESELIKARNDGVKVYINGHHPPVGQFEGHSVDDFWPIYTQRYVQLMESFEDIVVTGFFGHEHVDEFRLLRKCTYYSEPSKTSSVNSCTGDPFGVVFIGQCMSNCGSPSFREWKYDKVSMELIDYNSYVYNENYHEVKAVEDVFSKNNWNNKIKKDESKMSTSSSYSAEWPLQYQWSEAYPNMKNMRASEWEKQLNEMSSNETAFEEFMKLRQPSNPSCISGDYATQCKNWMLCNYGYGTYAEFLDCVYRGYKSYQLLVSKDLDKSRHHETDELDILIETMP